MSMRICTTIRMCGVPASARLLLTLFLIVMMTAFGSTVAQHSARAANVVHAEKVMEIEVQKGSILRLSRDAETIFVADPKVADVQSRSKKTIFIYGKQTGETTLYALDDNDRPILTRILRVTHNVSRINSMIEQLAPDADVEVTSIDGGVVLQGVVQTPRAADDIRRLVTQYIGAQETIINRVTVLAPTQVNLRVRFAEVSRELLRSLGISWDAFAQQSNFAFGVLTARPEVSVGSDLSTISATYATPSGNTDISAIIDALEDEGVLSVLAEPNLTALSGETATFLAGGEFPIPVGVNDNDIRIEFKQFGVSLAFTPTVMSSDMINLKVQPEVSALTETGSVVLSSVVIPGLSTRRAETTVELGSGQSFAIAGLIQNRTNNNINKVPGLGDLPILGKLFQSRRFQKEETELVIIVTPYLVRPVDPREKLKVPTDRLADDRQFERLLVNRMSNDPDQSVNSPAATGQSLSGDVGFIVE